MFKALVRTFNVNYLKKIHTFTKKVILQANNCRIWMKTGWKGAGAISVVFDRFEVVLRRVPIFLVFSKAFSIQEI